MLKKLSRIFFQSRIFLLIFLGSLSWSLTMVKSGWIYPYGMGFWGANGHDGIWHIALAEGFLHDLKDLSIGYYFKMPVFGGYALQNYHIGFDLILATIHKFTSIPVVNLYFQIIPPVFAFLIGFLTYKFVHLWTKSEKAGYWSTFFVYFGGSFAWILGKGESAFWSQQAISTLINPPFAMSLISILSGLIFLIKYQEIRDIRYLMLSALLFGLLVQIKIYAGLLVLFALAVLVLYRLLIIHDSKFLILFILTLAVSLLVYLPFNRFSAGVLVWHPFWFLETMMGLTDRVGWLKFYSAMITYKSGHIWYKLVPAYLVAFTIFWVGNMGTRIIKEIMVWKWVRDYKKIGWIEVFITSIIIAGGVLPMFFLQKGTPWNTIQFFYYSLFFSGILAGIALSRATNYIILATVLLTVPTTIITLKDVYLPSRPPAMLSNYELSGLNFLRDQPSGVVLTYPFDPIKAKEAETNPPRPLYLYESTAYVSAFSRHSVFLEDEVNLDITGYNWKERRFQIEDWYKEKDQNKIREFLKTNNIKYIYWLKGQRAFLGESQLGLKRIFENKEVDIYEVN